MSTSTNNEIIKRKEISEPIVKNMFESQKEFIVLGLVGKTGSGVSTVSNILNSDFNELKLPQPCEESHADINKTEYRLMYNFAEKNWRKFYKIKTSSLIVTSALKKTKEEFCEYLFGFLPNDPVSESHESEYKHNINETVKSLYEKTIDFHLDNLAVKGIDENKIDHSEYSNSLKNFKSDIQSLTSTNPDNVNVNIDKGIISLSVVEVNNLFYKYKETRINKTGLKNYLFYEILFQYIYFELPKITQSFWTDLSKASKGLIKTIILQDMGNNLRITKKEPFSKDSIEEDGYSGIAELINISIKLLRDYKYKKFWMLMHNCKTSYTKEEQRLINLEKQAFIVIDSIKNPYESMYLKKRYSNYYLIAIYTDESRRKRRLEHNLRLESTEIDVIDITEQLSEFKKNYREYKKKSGIIDDEGSNRQSNTNMLEQIFKKMSAIKCDSIYPFIMQNIQDCIESADIFINNKDESYSFLSLKKKVLRYVCLIMYPGLVLPTAIERCMQIANTAKMCSGCISRQVGAVLTDNKYNLMAIGWNQQPENQVPCLYRSITEARNHCNSEAYSDYENDDNKSFQENIKIPVDTYYQKKDLCSITNEGRNISYCFKDIYNEIEKNKNQIHPRALHAEETAFLNLNRTGADSINGGYLFTTSSPCELCSKKAMYMGITRIYYVQPYPGISDSHVLSAGVTNSRPELELYTGAIGRAYTQLYTPIMPKKDELELWMGHKVSVSDYPKFDESRGEKNNE